MGERRRLGAAIVGAAAGLAVAAAGAPPASAGTYHVYGLGLNGAGCGGGWVAHTFSDKFVQADRCTSWDIRTTRDGRPIPEGGAAGASMYTAVGARFTGFAIKSRGRAQNGVYWIFAMCSTSFSDCSGHIPQQGTWSETDFRLGSLLNGYPRYARHVFAGLKCYEKSCPDSSTAGRAGDITQLHSQAAIEDFTAPGSPRLSGVSTGWNSGQKKLSYTASDAGSGISAVTLTVDGSLSRMITHSCARLPGGGYAHPVPCALGTGSAFTVNAPGQLADGRHTLAVSAADAGGARTSTTQTFLVDNNAPAAPTSLAVEGGAGWRRTNGFSLGWAVPEQAPGSPVTTAYYKVGAPPATPSDGTLLSGAPPLRAEDVRVRGDGDWPVHVWLRDAAGNADHRRSAVARLRLDTTPPAVAFMAARAADNPAEVRARVGDASSGVAGGRIEIRRHGAAEWQPLETAREGGELVATVPDERLERGTYELRAEAWDAVGNRAATTRRADGRAMVLEVPLRAEAHVAARLAPPRATARSARAKLTVGYRRPAWLHGVLRRASGVPLADTRLAVQSRRLGSAEWLPLAEVTTDQQGRYGMRVPRGPSREIRVVFAGTRVLRPASATAELRVRGASSLALRPRRLRRGGTIRFVGRVGLFRAKVPVRGKLVQIQYLDGRRWRPAVRLGRTDADGRFSIPYRFRRISRPTRILFRILVPAESGWPYATGASPVRTARVRP